MKPLRQSEKDYISHNTPDRIAWLARKMLVADAAKGRHLRWTRHTAWRKHERGVAA
jgi:hypothetical protein